MTVQKKRIKTRPAQVLQLNANRSTTVMNTIHATHCNDTNIILYQEPGFTPYPATPFLPPNAIGFTPILPIPIESLRRQEQFPRVMAYAKTRPNLTVIPRYDICEDLDMMVLEIHQLARPPYLVVNLYNPGRGTKDAHSTGQRLTRLNLPQNSAAILAGDFNLHHPDWENINSAPIPAAQQMSDWFQQQCYSIHNAHGSPTYFSHDGHFQSVIDLTLSNAESSRQNLMQEWRIDPTMQEISDHVAICFELGYGRQMTDTFACTPLMR